MKNKKSLGLMGRLFFACLLTILITSSLLPQSLTFSIPDTSARANSLLKIPIRTTNVSGLGILSISITLTFDENILDALGANSLGTLSQNWGNPLTTDEPGKMELVMIGLSPLAGDGVLTYLFFDVTGNRDDTTSIRFKNISINEGKIVALPLHGKFTALPGIPAPGLKLALPDTSANVGSMINLPIRLSNRWHIGIDSLRLTCTFNKYVVDALDVLTENTLTQNWTDSIEARHPGKLSFLLKGTPAISDSGILCYLKFRLKGSPGMATRIHFQGVRLYPDTLKAGAVNGAIAIAGGTTSEVIASIPDISADSSATIDVPIFISDLTNKDVWSVSITLKFDNNVLKYQSFDLTNSILAGWQSTINKDDPDLIRFGAIGMPALAGQGLLAEFQFKVIGKPGMQTSVSFAKMELNEGSPTVTAYDGLFTVNYVIPVELVSFDAKRVNRDVILSWQTETESNNYGFEIERSDQSERWHKIGFVAGHGSSTQPHLYSFIDKNLQAGIHWYRLKQIDSNGKFEYFQPIQISIDQPRQFVLSQNYPNPFNPATTIAFNLPQSARLKLTLFNLIGEEVKILGSGEYAAGHHEIRLTADHLKTGLYFYKLETDDFVAVKKLLVLK